MNPFNIVIRVNENGQVTNVEGPLGKETIMYGALEAAKIMTREWNLEQERRSRSGESSPEVILPNGRMMAGLGIK